MHNSGTGRPTSLNRAIAADRRSSLSHLVQQIDMEQLEAVARGNHERLALLAQAEHFAVISPRRRGECPTNVKESDMVVSVESRSDVEAVRSIYCSADGKGLYLVGTPQAGVSALYYTDLRGQARLLWQQKGVFGLAAWASPDGRYLAITGVPMASDAWLLENF
jgi:hypothetical protein